MIGYLLIVAISVLSALKVTVQGKFSKLFVKDTVDITAFIAGGFIVISVILFCVFGLNGVKTETLIYGVVLGVLTTFFQLFYTKAMKNGPVSITALVANLQIILPTIFSAIFYNDEFGVFKILGVVFLIASMFLLLRPKDGEKTKLWILFVMIAFLSGGSASIVQKIQAESIVSEQRNQMVLICYMTASVLTSIILVINRIGCKKPTFRFNLKTSGLMIALGATLCAYQVLLVYLISIMPGTIVYPLHNVMVVLFTAVMGFIFFKEKFDKFSLIGIIVSALSILFLVL